MMAADQPKEPTPLKQVNTGRSGAQVELRSVSLKDRAGKNLLKEISLFIQPGEVVVLTGPDARPLTALLHMMSGVGSRKNSGVFINGVDMGLNYRAFRSVIGLVAARDPLLDFDTVTEMVESTARLSLPRGTAKETYRQAVSSILRILGLQPYAATRINRLTDPLRRLVSIAVEAVRFPALLLVDEPEGRQDSYSEQKTYGLLRALAGRGMSIVVASRNPGILDNADKVAVLTPGGELAWYGPPSKAREYMAALGIVPTEGDAWQQMLSVVETDPRDWSKSFREQAAYQQYSLNPLSIDRPDLLLQERPLNRLRGMEEEPRPPEPVRASSPAAQVFLLAGRALRSIMRTRLLLAALAPVAAGILHLVVSSPRMFDASQGNAERAAASLGLLILFAMLIPALLFSQMMINERELLLLNRRQFMGAGPYLISKIIALTLFCLYQSLILGMIHFVAAGGNGGLNGALIMTGTLFLVGFTGGLLGLLASGAAPSPAFAVGLALFLTLPQFVIGGVLAPLPTSGSISQSASLLMPARYSFEAAITASGFGASLVEDACWQLPSDQRAQLSDTQKQACGCMGNNVFSSCNFPGVHAAFTPALEQPEPQAPSVENALLPVQPVLQPGQTLDEYAQEINGYTLALELYQGNLDSFITRLRQYAAAYGDWQHERSLAIGRAEGVISAAFERYGPFLGVSLLADWIALAGFCLLLSILLLMVIHRKGIG